MRVRGIDISPMQHAMHEFMGSLKKKSWKKHTLQNKHWFLFVSDVPTVGDPVCWYKIPTLKTDLFKELLLIKTPSQEEKKETVNVYWGHWEGPLFTLDTASGYTHTHTHITYGSCVPITQHKAKTHKQTKTRTHALTLAEAKASILFVYVTLVLFYHY